MAKRVAPKPGCLTTLSRLKHLQYFYMMRGKKIRYMEIYQFLNPYKSKDILLISVYPVELRICLKTGDGQFVRKSKKKTGLKWSMQVCPMTSVTD